MPALSPTMQNGTIAAFLKKVGDKVAPGDAVAEVQTDKATMAFEAQDDFVIAKLLVEPGAEVAVGAPIMVTVEDASFVAAFANFTAPAAAAAAAPAAAPAPAPAAAPAPKAAAAAPAPAPVAAAPKAPAPAPAVAAAAAAPAAPSAAVYSVRWGTGVAKSALSAKLAKDQEAYVAKYGRGAQQPIKA